MGNRAVNEGLLDGLEGFSGFLAAPGHDVGEGAFADGGVKEVAKKLTQAGVGQELVVAQVEDGSLDPRAVLGRGRDVSGKGGGDSFAATGTAATSGAVLGDFKFFRRDVEDLSYFVIARR